MRLLHTADWHLGKTLKGQSLLDDQIFIMNQLFDIIDDQKPDAILICGDIYDRNIPPAAAVELFDEILTRFAEKKLPTLIIAGNHDSATRLNFGSELFARQNIFIAAKVENEPKTIVLTDKFGEIYFSMLPYFEPGEIKAKFLAEDAPRPNYNDANKFYVELARKKIPQGKRSVVLAHIFLTGGIESESERKFVGGAENVAAQVFSAYNYVALGHLHSPQRFYAGSPLKYSFDEAKQKKSVSIVEIDGSGAAEVKKIPLTPRHDVKIVRGTLDELKKLPKTEDYICAQLTERVINVQDKLSWIFPNILSVEFDLAQNFLSPVEKERISRENLSTLDYFADFFESQTNETLNNDYRNAMKELFIKIEHEEREI